MKKIPVIQRAEEIFPKMQGAAVVTSDAAETGAILSDGCLSVPAE